MASARFFHRAASVARGCAAGGVALAYQSVKPTASCFNFSPLKVSGASLNVTHDSDDEWAGANDGKNHFSDKRFLMFWLESEKNGEYSNFHLADVYFPCEEFHLKLQPLLSRDEKTGLAKFCCSEALMFTIKLNLLITWADTKYTAADPACQELIHRIQDAVVKLIDARDGDSVKEASRVQSDLIYAFNQEVWFTNVQAYVQYAIVWSKFRGSNNKRLLDQLEAIPQGTIPLEASPWDKIYGACPDKSYDCFQRDESRSDPPHREGHPVGTHKAFLQLLQIKFGESDGLRFGPKNGLGLNYLGIAVERTRFHTGAQTQPGLRGLLGADGKAVAAHPQYKEYCDFLAARIA